MAPDISPTVQRLFYHLSVPQNSTPTEFLATLQLLLDSFVNAYSSSSTSATTTANNDNIDNPDHLIFALLNLLRLSGSFAPTPSWPITIDDLQPIIPSVSAALSVLLEKFTFVQLNEMGMLPFIKTGLEWKDAEEIQFLSLSQLEKIPPPSVTSSAETVLSGLDHSDMWAGLAASLFFSSSNVGTKTVDVISLLYAYHFAQPRILDLLTFSSTHLPRILDLILSLTRTYPLSFSTLSGHLTNAVSQMPVRDVLLHLNVVDFYSNLLSSPPEAGVLLYFTNSGILDGVLKIDVQDQFLAPHVFDFMISLAKNYSEEFVSTLDAQYSILQSLEHQITSSSSSLHSNALIAFPRIFTTSVTLSNYIVQHRTSFLKEFYPRALTSSRPTPEKILSLAILTAPRFLTSQIELIWSNWDVDNILDNLVLKVLRNPDFIVHVLNLLKAISGHVFGVRLIVRKGQIMAFLLDREGVQYETMEAKYAVVQRLLETSDSQIRPVNGTDEAVINGVNGTTDGDPLGRWRRRTDEFVSRGVWWSTGVSHVVTEGA